MKYQLTLSSSDNGRQKLYSTFITDIEMVHLLLMTNTSIVKNRIVNKTTVLNVELRVDSTLLNQLTRPLLLFLSLSISSLCVLGRGL